MSDRHDTKPMSADVPCPSESLWDRLALRIGAEADVRPLYAPSQQWSEPEWEEVAPGISCKCLAVDVRNKRGELWINGRKFCPDVHNRTESGDAHPSLWSESGCTGVTHRNL